MTEMDRRQQTIFALATPPGRGGVAIIRLSGREAGMIAAQISRQTVPPPRVAARRKFYHPNSAEIIDDGLLLWFPAPNSFTGEDCAEFHLHGGPAVIAAMYQILQAEPNCRLAEPGEFARRAFHHGKLDLTEIEALSDLIAAETEAQRRQALRQLGGALSQQLAQWREQIAQAAARIEALIDFAEEAIPDDTFDQVRNALLEIIAEIERFLGDQHRGERLRSGVTIVITGAPNVGKSSLFNRLAQEEAAITSPHPGTTRDLLRIDLDLGGYPVRLIDSAGLRTTSDPVESAGIARARAAAANADLILQISSADVASDDDRMPVPDAAERWRIENKIDLNAGLLAQDEPPDFSLSLKTGAGVAELIAALGDFARRKAGSGGDPVITRARHRSELETVAAALRDALGHPISSIELIAEALRHAVAAIGRLTGRIDTEGLLDRIFAEFCIGK